MTATTRRAILIVTIAAVVVWAWQQRTPKESPTERAYRVCAECGLDPSEVDRLIESARQSTLGREQNLELYRQQSEGKPAIDCEPCAMAVLDAAGK